MTGDAKGERMMKLYPWNDVIEQIRLQLLAKSPATYYQQFRCTNCGGKLTMDDANTFYAVGFCDQPECAGIETDIRKDGCNYMLILGDPQPIGLKAPERPGLTIVLPMDEAP